MEPCETEELMFLIGSLINKGVLIEHWVSIKEDQLSIKFVVKEPRFSLANLEIRDKNWVFWRLIEKKNPKDH